MTASDVSEKGSECKEGAILRKRAGRRASSRRSRQAVSSKRRVSFRVSLLMLAKWALRWVRDGRRDADGRSEIEGNLVRDRRVGKEGRGDVLSGTSAMGGRGDERSFVRGGGLVCGGSVEGPADSSISAIYSYRHTI